MPKTFEQSQDEIARLVQYFRTNRAMFRAPGAKEAHARQELIDPLFLALGWDVHNAERTAPQYRDVVFEDSLEIEGAHKAPDYAFRIGKEIKFYTEAKKPSVPIETERDPAYQLRRYGWNGKLPLSLLTNFEYLAVYNCRIRPRERDKPTIALVKRYSFEAYPDDWRQVWDIFSKPAVLGGSFDQFVQTGLSKRGISPVDAEFLKDIEQWRLLLARNMALRNRELSTDDLNDAVQRTIDRIIFLRIAEDRGIEAYERLLKLTRGEHHYAELVRLFRLADHKYNSGLFDFSRRGDTLTPTLEVDDAPLKEIITNLYAPQSPYKFDIMPVEILGNVYEQFLGKVIHLTPTHQARVEDKPEVRKAGGVYYTPAYIVDYIVKQTVGRAIEGKSPKQLDEFRVLDMACGSGSFLLGAYQYLLDYYLKWYIEHEPTKYRKAVRQDRDEWRLTTAERKRVLTTHIFGVDIDRQAVEVTKLSLLLKVLEGESDETLQPTLDGLHERALPNLDQNIKCGNSLIGPDYFSGQMFPNGEELKRLNPFDWAREFPEAMKAGGFDCVIGNPPYVRQESLAVLKNYLAQKYASFESTADLYVYFIEKGLQLLGAGGLFSVIVSSSFLRTTYGARLRNFIRANNAILSIVDFGGFSVFEDARDVYVSIPLLGKRSQPEQVSVCRVITLPTFDLIAYVPEHQYLIPASRFIDSGWTLENERVIKVFDKIKLASVPLGDYLRRQIFMGLKTGLNEAFEIDEETRERIIQTNQKCRKLIKPFLGGQDIRRYSIRDSRRYLIVIPAGWTRRQLPQSIGLSTTIAEREAWNWFSHEYAPIAQHLESFVAKAKRRQDQGEFWWELRPCDYYWALEKAKIVYPDIAKNPRFCFDTSGIYISNTAYCLATDDLHLLGILNSRVTWFAIGQISIPFGTRAGEFRYRLIYQYIEQLPIRPINSSYPADRARHDRMVELVELMLELHKRLQAANSQADRELYQRQIDATDQQIDALVYELYGLTSEEIQVVERNRG